ncbi:MAG TPA: alpha/beta hydrolase, partial [Candidatus Competibacteraceae bacterium]|nr:alpha/beta hydrolase [Candidatus Competibacteraceae bacterium]
IALLFAAAYPGRVRAAICEAAHVLIEEVCLTGIEAARGAYERGELRKALHRYHGANTDLAFRGWCDTWLRPSRRRWNVEAELPHITCPTLIVQGMDDEYATRTQVDAIAAGVAGLREILWLPGCGHVPHHQARDIVLASAARFIEQQCATL